MISGRTAHAPLSRASIMPCDAQVEEAAVALHGGRPRPVPPGPTTHPC